MTNTNTPTNPGRGWAYVGAVLGGLVSIAANVAHSFIPPHSAPAGWTPEVGAVIGAIVWPVFLFIAVEILARVTWPQGIWWGLLRFGGMLPVALVAAFVSYRHLSGLLAHYGEESIVYYLGPLAVDGLMVMATGALLATSRHRTNQVTDQPTPVSPATPAPTVPAMSAVPQPTTPAAQPPAVEPAPVAVPVDVPERPAVPTPADLAARITQPRPLARVIDTEPGTAERTTATRPTTRQTTPDTLPASAIDSSITAPEPAQLPLPIVPPELLDRATRIVRQYRTEHGTPITTGQLAVRLQVPSGIASNLLAAVNSQDNPTTPTTTVNGARSATR
jgi:Protein of unknown function (DUF2637)